LSVSYVLTGAAEADLRGIIRYMRERWGEAQARSYAAKLRTGIERVAAGSGVSKDMSALYPGLRGSNANITIFSACRARPPRHSWWRSCMSEWI